MTQKTNSVALRGPRVEIMPLSLSKLVELVDLDKYSSLPSGTIFSLNAEAS